MDDGYQTIGDRTYTMLSTESWIDIKDLTVQLFKGKTGIEVRVYPRHIEDGIEPLGVIRADYCEKKRNRRNVIPFNPNNLSYDPNGGRNGNN